MNYHNITKNDMLNGSGLRVVLWVSGCIHNCKNCHNPQTHSINSGILFDEQAKQELFEELQRPHVSGITFSGGDPLHPNNISIIHELCSEIRFKFKDKNIIIYTGYEWEQINHLQLLKYIDVIIVGKFVEELHNNNLKWVGSSNQRIIDVQKSLAENKVILYKM